MPTTTAAQPTSVTVHQASRVLEIGFDDGRSFRIPFELMRVYSPSAEVQGHGPGQETLQTGKRDVVITDIAPVGHYALQPRFSDGHESGIFSWDFFTLRRARYRVRPDENKVFAGGNLPEVPVRTYGRLRQADEGLVFTYRPWLVLPARTVKVAGDNLAVGKGLFFSTVITGKDETYFILPPRYRGHEDELVKTYGWTGVQPAGLRKAWSVVRELFGGGAAKAQVA